MRHVRPMTAHGFRLPPTAVLIGTALLAGSILGIGTQILQGVLPGGWGVLANSGVVWALAAVALGLTASSPRWGAASGAIALVAASVTYNAAAAWFEGAGTAVSGVIIWSCAGVVAGSVFGIAGFLTRRAPSWRRPAAALVAGVLAGEGVHLTWFVGNPALRLAGVSELVIAATIAILCLFGGSRRPVSVAVLVVAAGATLVAGRVINLAFLT